MTNNRTVKDEGRYASDSEHLATPGREAGVVFEVDVVRPFINEKNFDVVPLHR